jgi:hypothetical protein
VELEKARQIKIAVAAKMRVMEKPRRHPLKKGPKLVIMLLPPPELQKQVPA